MPGGERAGENNPLTLSTGGNSNVLLGHKPILVLWLLSQVRFALLALEPCVALGGRGCPGAGVGAHEWGSCWLQPPPPGASVELVVTGHDGALLRAGVCGWVQGYST